MSAELSVSKAWHPLLHAVELREICPLSTLVSAGRLLGRATAGHGELNVLYAFGTGVSQLTTPAHSLSVTTTWENEPWI